MAATNKAIMAAVSGNSELENAMQEAVKAGNKTETVQKETAQSTATTYRAQFTLENAVKVGAKIGKSRANKKITALLTDEFFAALDAEING